MHSDAKCLATSAFITHTHMRTVAAMCMCVQLSYVNMHHIIYFYIFICVHTLLLVFIVQLHNQEPLKVNALRCVDLYALYRLEVGYNFFSFDVTANFK